MNLLRKHKIFWVCVRVFKIMSCEESKIIVYICRYLPLILMICVQVRYNIERLCDIVPQWFKSNLSILSTLKSMLYTAQVILDRKSSYKAHIHLRILCSTHYTASKKIREVRASDSRPKRTKNLHVQLAYTTLCVREVRLQSRIPPSPFPSPPSRLPASHSFLQLAAILVV